MGRAALDPLRATPASVSPAVSRSAPSAGSSRPCWSLQRKALSGRLRRVARTQRCGDTGHLGGAPQLGLFWLHRDPLGTVVASFTKSCCCHLLRLQMFRPDPSRPKLGLFPPHPRSHEESWTPLLSFSAAGHPRPATPPQGCPTLQASPRGAPLGWPSKQRISCPLLAPDRSVASCGVGGAGAREQRRLVS